MKKIELTQGKYALVDNEDYDSLNRHKWSLRLGQYAGRYENNQHIYMHRVVNSTPDNLLTDHINGDTLDNRKENLRSVNKSQNGINRGKQKNNTSGYKGVNFHRGKWVAELVVKRQKHYLGRFSELRDAVRARQEAEVKYHGI